MPPQARALNPPELIAPTWRHLLALAVLIALFAGVASSDGLNQALLRLVVALEAIITAHPL